MGRLELQGIVAGEEALPFVQFRQLDDDGNVEAQWQMTPAEAREHAQKVVEASMNAVYDAAMTAWAKEAWPDNPDVWASLLILIRKYRADIWGLPDQPEDWRPTET